MLPNLIVIGAAKCGTTSLHAYLDEHPDVSMSAEKELDFFVPEKNGGRDVAWYEAQFDASAAVRGESSPSYTTHPFYAGVPERMHALVPHARLVYVVRDPIERTVSHYMYRLLTHPRMGSFEQALDDPDHGPWLLGISRYWLQLEQYLRLFDAERILVVDSDELRADRDGQLARVYGFLGLEPAAARADAEEHNRGRQVLRTRTGVSLLKGLYRTLGPERAQAVVSHAPETVKARFRRPIERPVLSEATRERLAEELGGEVERLRAHTGLAFAGWTL